MAKSTGHSSGTERRLAAITSPHPLARYRLEPEREGGFARATIGLIAFAIAGCYTPAGRVFEPAPGPAATEEATAYVYHVRRSAWARDYGERVFVDGIEQGLLRTNRGGVCEYLWLYLMPGPHHVEVATNSHWFNLGSIPGNPVRRDMIAEAGRVYIFRVVTSQSVQPTFNPDGAPSGSGYGPAEKWLTYSEGLDDEPEIRNCHLVETPTTE